MTDGDEMGRYVDDALLIGSRELLMDGDGRLMVVPRASNTADKPLEPMQEELLMVVVAETGNTPVEETYPLEVSALDEGQGGSLENNTFV
jgi:hypothetical protein